MMILCVCENQMKPRQATETAAEIQQLIYQSPRNAGGLQRSLKPTLFVMWQKHFIINISAIIQFRR